MIRAAEESGALTPDKTILEPTSGNTGISLAMVARAKGYRLLCVLPDIVTPEREQLLRAFGAEVMYAEGARSTNDAIFMAQKMADADPDKYFMPYQYGNENNPRAHYETTGPEILRDLPQVDVFVAGLGTGGTLTGVGRYLKEQNAETKVIAAVPHPGDLVQGLRDLGEGFIPPVLDESDPRRSHRRRFAVVVRDGEGADGERGDLRRHLCRRRPQGRRPRRPSASSAATSSPSLPTAAGSTSRPASGRGTTARSRRKRCRGRCGGERPVRHSERRPRSCQRSRISAKESGARPWQLVARHRARGIGRIP